MAKIVELIYTEERIGKGTEDDVARILKCLWTKDGKLVASLDPVGGATCLMENFNF